MTRNKIKELPRLKSSFYENIFNVYETEDNKYFYNLYNRITFDNTDFSENIYTEHVFSIGDNWTLLSNRYYNSISLWWIICLANNIRNPLDLPEPGTKLKILNRDVVNDIIQTILNA